MAKLNPMIVAETVTLAVVEILRLFADRGLSKGKLDELHQKLAGAVQADQRTMESFIRAELAAQIESLRAENHRRHVALRRDVRRWVVGLGLLTIAASVGSAALLGWMLRVG
jgi:negative regulator of sigma E activity